MEKGAIGGPQETVTKETSMRTKDKVLASTLGQMEAFTRVNGSRIE